MSLELFKILESQTCKFWTAIHAGLDAKRLARLAAMLEVSPEELLNAAPPLDRIESCVTRFGDIFAPRATTKIHDRWCALMITRDRLFQMHAGLIAGTVHRYHYTGSLESEDLWQEGALGLMKAICRFDWRKGFQFSTYATHWIRHSVGRAVANKRDTIRLPIYAQEKKLPHPRIVEESAGASVADPTASALSQLMTQEAGSALHDYLDRLEPMQRDIIERRFGFKGEPQKLAEIGKIYNLSRERIRQIEQAALDELRGMVKA
jgi:RNA polymerase primary sigma factor